MSARHLRIVVREVASWIVLPSPDMQFIEGIEPIAVGCAVEIEEIAFQRRRSLERDIFHSNEFQPANLHVIKQLAAQIPGPARNSPLVKDLESWGCLTRMHVVRLIAPMVEHEDQAKDVDFSKCGIRRRWDAGYADATIALRRAPWRSTFDPLEGVILHEFESQGAVQMSPQTGARPAGLLFGDAGNRMTPVMTGKGVPVIATTPSWLLAQAQKERAGSV